MLKEREWRRIRFKTGGIDSREYAISKGAYVRNGYIDVTEKWMKDSKPNSHKIIRLNEYEVNGTTYFVDGINVKNIHSKRELEVAEILESVLGGEIKLVPEINGQYSGISTPDYIYRGQRYDLKELKGCSKDAIRNAIHKKKKQADNFIIDITESGLSEEEINVQAEEVFTSFNTDFVQTLILIKNKTILRILQRK